MTHALCVGDWVSIFSIASASSANGVVVSIGPEKKPIYRVQVYNMEQATNRYRYFRASLTAAGIANRTFVRVIRDPETGRWNSDKDCYCSKPQ